MRVTNGRTSITMPYFARRPQRTDAHEVPDHGEHIATRMMSRFVANVSLQPNSGRTTVGSDA